MNLPNRLTIIRLILVPVFVFLMSMDHLATYVLAYIVFMVASITDYWDGRIARERNLITNFGKLMDPLADKVLMAAAFVMLMEVPVLTVPGWAIVAIIAREFLITGARSVAAPGGKVLAANIWGKVKTVMQMTYIYTFLFLAIVAKLVESWAGDYVDVYGAVLGRASLVGIIIVALFTVYTGLQFAQSNWKELRLGTEI